MRRVRKRANCTSQRNIGHSSRTVAWFSARLQRLPSALLHAAIAEALAPVGRSVVRESGHLQTEGRRSCVAKAKAAATDLFAIGTPMDICFARPCQPAVGLGAPAPDTCAAEGSLRPRAACSTIPMGSHAERAW